MLRYERGSRVPHVARPAIVGALLLPVVSLTGCSAAEAPAPSLPTPAGIDLSVVLDTESGAITLPYERLVASEEEREILHAASSAVVARCAQDIGIPYFGVELQFPDIYRSETIWGPWTVEQAERFGFISPMTDADLVANGYLPQPTGTPERYHPNFDLTDAQRDEVEASCLDADEFRYFDEVAWRDAPWDLEMDAIWQSLPDREDVRQLFDEVGACYRAAGLEPESTMPYLVTAAANEISETTVRAALAVVGCKDEVDFTRRISQIEADLQAEVIAEYTDEIVARRARIDEAIERARRVIADSRDVIYVEQR